MNEYRDFYEKEKEKFNNLLKKFNWTEEGLLNEKEIFVQCPFDQGHRFPIQSKHLQICQLSKQGFYKDDFKELVEYQHGKQLSNQSGIFLTSEMLSNILHRPITIPNNIPLSIEQTTILFTSEERALIAQAVHNEALRLNIVPPTPISITDYQHHQHDSIQSEDSNIFQPSNKLSELRDRKRRRTKYVTRTNKKSFYDIAREMINSEMELLQHDQEHKNSSKRKHRSSSKKKKKKHRSHSSHKHHRHSKKHRKN